MSKVLEVRLGNDWIPDLEPLLDADGSLLTGASVTFTLSTSPDIDAQPIHGTLRRPATEDPAVPARYVVRFLGRDLTPHLSHAGVSLVYLIVTSTTRYRAVHRVRVRG